MKHKTTKKNFDLSVRVKLILFKVRKNNFFVIDSLILNLVPLLNQFKLAFKFFI